MNRHDVKITNTAQGQFGGYAARWDEPDRDGDVLVKGALAHALSTARRRKALHGDGGMYPLLWMGKPEQPVGVCDVTEDDTGVYVQAQCDLQTDSGRGAFSGVREGYASALALAAEPVRVQRTTTGKKVLEARLMGVALLPQGYSLAPSAHVDAMSVKTRQEGERWGSRVPLAPYHHPPTAPPEPEPQPDDPAYVNRPAAWEAAHDTWIADAYGVRSEAALRKLDQEADYAAFLARTRDWEARRVALSGTLTERLRAAPVDPAAEARQLDEIKRQWEGLFTPPTTE